MSDDYRFFGRFLDDDNPYARVSRVPAPSDPQSRILAVSKSTIRDAAAPVAPRPTITGAPLLYWPFRLIPDSEDPLGYRRPAEDGPLLWFGEGPTSPGKTLEVEQLPIIKTLVVPYQYDRVVGNPPPPPPPADPIPTATGTADALLGGATIKMFAHLVIGYTMPTPIPVSAAGLASVAGDGDPDDEAARRALYENLGTFLGAQHPALTGELKQLFDAEGRELPDPDVSTWETQLSTDFSPPYGELKKELVPPLFMHAVSWLMNKSKGNAALGIKDSFASSSDDEMELFQKQQCLTWAVPQPFNGDNIYHDTWWLRFYQVTKALKARYIVLNRAGQPVLEGWLVVGYSGSGNC